MSLGLRILSGIVLLGVALAVQLSLNATGSLRSAQRAEFMLGLNAHGTRLLDTAGALAAERGLTNGALANPASASDAARAAIATQRGKAEAARSQAMDGIAALPAAAGSGVVDEVATERVAAGRLNALRQLVDQASQRQGTPPTQAEWFSGATAEIDSITRLRRLIEASGQQEPDVSRLIAVRDALAEMSEFGGRERGRINGAIAAKAHLTGADMSEIGLLRGRVEGAWSRLGTSGNSATPAVADAIRDAGTAMFETLQETRRPVLEAAAAACGAADPGLHDSDSAALGARELATSIAELTRQMDQAARATQAAVDRAAETRRSFDALSSNVAAIDDVAKLIAEIAGHTNLLAPNATIEAARAGEACKGFAAVASEVKQLAGQTAQSTEQITRRVSAIAGATHEARQALAGIVGAVGDLETIATQVAAAIEQQSAATASIAGAVESTSLAARHTVDQLGGVTQATDACSRVAGDMHAISQEVANRVLGLKVALAQLLHSRVAELDRHTSARRTVRLNARLEHGGGVAEGTLLDVSAGGARFVGAARGVNRATLKVSQLPEVAVSVVETTEDGLRLAFEFASESEREEMAAAVARLAEARVGA